jgi:AraC-like DNA-binding protein
VPAEGGRTSQSERIEFFRPRDLPGAEILLAERSARHWHWFHQTYTICTVLAGQGATDWIYRSRFHSATPGALLLMEPGEVHANQNVLPEASFRVLFLAPYMVIEAAAEMGLKSPTPHWKSAHVSNPEFFSVMRRFHEAQESGSSPLELSSRLFGCLVPLLEHCTESAPRTPGHPGRAGLLRARDFIRAHYQRAIALDELATESGLSRFHLVRTFAKVFGLPPHSYQVHVQVEKARALLARGMRLSLIAAEVGFSDQSHLTRHFRRIVGVTPAEYQRGC